MSHRKQADTDKAETRYGDELLSANWNPVIDLLAWSCAQTSAEASRDARDALREEDAEGFLGRIYTLGC